MGCKESEEVMVGYGVTTLMRFFDDPRDELLLIESFEMSKVLQHDCLNRSGPSKHHGDRHLFYGLDLSLALQLKLLSTVITTSCEQRTGRCLAALHAASSELCGVCLVTLVGRRRVGTGRRAGVGGSATTAVTGNGARRSA